MFSAHTAKVVAAVGGIITLSAYQVLGAQRTREGHDALSSEKPIALRGEAERDLAVEKAKVRASDAARAAAREAKAAATK